MVAFWKLAWIYIGHSPTHRRNYVLIPLPCDVGSKERSDTPETVKDHLRANITFRCTKSFFTSDVTYKNVVKVFFILCVGECPVYIHAIFRTLLLFVCLFVLFCFCFVFVLFLFCFFGGVGVLLFVEKIISCEVRKMSAMFPVACSSNSGSQIFYCPYFIANQLCMQLLGWVLPLLLQFCRDLCQF